MARATSTARQRLPPLPLASLRDIAVLCGLHSSGTKDVLRARLASVITRPAEPAEAPSRRILSLDMGVRNLAYCLLRLDAPPSGSRSGGGAAPPPTLVAWERLSLIGGSGSDAAAFSPPAMASVAARLVQDRLLPLEPTRVLIERQRFRSGGAAAVLEWTVRVNSLETMLHAIFAYRQLAAESAGGRAPSVDAVSPQRVSLFLLRGGLGSGNLPTAAQRVKASKPKDIKDSKEAFVARALRPETGGQQTIPLLAYDESVRHMVDAYLARWDSKQKRSRTRITSTAALDDALDAPGPLSKIDDLADCATQGLAALAWERNREILRERGAEALLAEKPLAG